MVILYHGSGRLIVNDLKFLTKRRTDDQTFNTLKKKPFENIVGKGENAGNANAFNLEQSKNLSFGKQFRMVGESGFNNISLK